MDRHASLTKQCAGIAALMSASVKGGGAARPLPVCAGPSRAQATHAPAKQLCKPSQDFTATGWYRASARSVALACMVLCPGTRQLPAAAKVPGLLDRLPRLEKAGLAGVPAPTDA